MILCKNSIYPVENERKTFLHERRILSQDSVTVDARIDRPTSSRNWKANFSLSRRAIFFWISSADQRVRMSCTGPRVRIRGSAFFQFSRRRSFRKPRQKAGRRGRMEVTQTIPECCTRRTGRRPRTQTISISVKRCAITLAIERPRRSAFDQRERPFIRVKSAPAHRRFFFLESPL